MRTKRMLLVASTLVGAMFFAGNALASHGGDHWTTLGGDPIVQGGVWTRGDFQKLITSSKGQTAMKYARLNSAERFAITKQVRKSNFRSCTMQYGEVFEWMTFGRNGTAVDRNVMFLDRRFRSGAPAWCVSATVNGKIVQIKVPKKCGNIAVPKRQPAPKPVPPKITPKPIPPKPTPKPIPVPPGSCNAIDSPGAIVCSTFYIVVVCGNLNVTITASTAQEAINKGANWQQANCAAAPPPATPVPVPTCPVGTTGTWPFCSTPPPSPVTTVVRAITTHDVYSSGEADLCFTVSRSDGSTVDPGAITVAPAEGAMVPGTLKFVPGTGWCQRWKAPVTTVTHNVGWTAYAYGASSSNTMTVRPSDTGG